MSDLVFYTHPMSRGRIVRWMLEETGAPYEHCLLDYATSMKEPDYLAVNAMGKVPAIVHKGKVVTEAAAICAYLADAFPEADLAPVPRDRADYYRWLFFAAGPVEAAVTNNYMQWQPTAEQSRMLGYGSFEATIANLEKAVAGKAYIAGNRFSAADVYVGAQLDWGMMFNTIPERQAFADYVGPLRERPAYKRARKIDAELVIEMKAANPG